MGGEQAKALGNPGPEHVGVMHRIARRAAGAEIIHPIAVMAPPARLLHLPEAIRITAIVRESSPEQGIGLLARTAALHQVVHLVNGPIDAARSSRLPGRRGQTPPTEEVLDRSWAKRRSASRRPGGGQANCWEGVLLLVLPMAEVEGPNKELLPLVHERPEMESRANREAVLPPGVNCLS